MMVQFNLLPDVKLEYIRTARTRRLVIAISIAVTALSVLVFASLFSTVHFVQKKSSNDLTKDISASSKKLKSISQIDRILTVQNQLNSLPAINDQKPATERLFGYISSITPQSVAINKLDIDFTKYTATVVGETDTIDQVNKYVDTIKFTTFKLEGEGHETTKAFSDVVLANFSRSDKNATYTITFNFDPTIFDATKQIQLTVPNITTTRSTISGTNVLFKQNSSGSDQ